MKLVKGEIRITEIPDGEAPLHIRENWVGLVLPVFATTEIKSESVLTHEETAREPVYMIPQDSAIDILGTTSPEAAAWWRDIGFPQDGGYFCFKISQAEVVGILREAPIHLFHGLLEVGVGAHDHPLNHR